MDPDALDWATIVLVITGALNWGLVGLFEFNLVAAFWDALLGADSAELLADLTYILVGLAGLYMIYTAYKMSADVEEAAERTTV